MLLSMTACDLSTILELAMDAAENADTGDSGGDETQPGEEQGDTTSWDSLDLPNGFPRLAESVDTFRFDEETQMYNFTWNSTDYATSEAMINTMNDWSNGRITGAVKGKITNWKIQNDRINLTASFDESSGMLMITTQVFGGTDLTAYLAAHTLTEEDFKPANFTEFSNFITSGELVANIIKAGVKSDFALYSEELATFGEDDVYNQADSAGFINLFGLPIKVQAQVNAKNAKK